MDIGSFQAYGLEGQLAGKTWRPALKGLNIDLGQNASICFDTERLRVAAAWTGGFIKLPTGRDGLQGVPQITGDLAFHTPMSPGWAGLKNEWKEPNPPVVNGEDVYSKGPIPREWAKWRGHYTHGDSVILSYTVGASSVLELPSFTNGIFQRQFEITRSPSKSPMSLLACEVPGATGSVKGNVALLEKDGHITGVAVLGSGVELKAENGRIITTILSPLPANHFHLGIWSGPKADVGKLHQFAKMKIKARALRELTKGGPAKWNQPVTTQGRLGLIPGPYVVDTISLPEENPWKSWIRCSGFDFFGDGESAAMCSVTGDVWIVTGINQDLKELQWRRFATGLFQPLGLKIVKGKCTCWVVTKSHVCTI